VTSQGAARPAAVARREPPVAVYGPNSALRQPSQLLRRMRADLDLALGLAWRLFLRDVRGQHRQSLLGYLWVLVPPVLNTLLWVFLSSQDIIEVDVPGVPYPIYVLTGTVLWQLVVDATTKPLQMASQARPVLVKLAFPLEALPIAALLHVTFSFLVRAVLLGGVLLWAGVGSMQALYLVPVGIFGLSLLGTAIGVLLLPAGLLYKDVEHGLPLAMQAGYYLTPVVYMAPTTWPASLVTVVNPVSPLLMMTRDSLLTGNTAGLGPAMLVMAITLPLLFTGWVVFRLALPFIIERLGG
jgi:lipopolysaccharide transport system permease protein